MVIVFTKSVLLYASVGMVAVDSPVEVAAVGDNLNPAMVEVLAPRNDVDAINASQVTGSFDDNSVASDGSELLSHDERKSISRTVDAVKAMLSPVTAKKRTLTAENNAAE